MASWVTKDTKGEGYVLNACVTPGVEYTITEDYPRDGYTYIIYDTDGNPIWTDEMNQYKFKIDDIDGNKVKAQDYIINLYNLHITGFVRIHKSGAIITDYDAFGFFYEDGDLEGVKFALYAADDIYYPDGETGPDGTDEKYVDGYQNIRGSQKPLFKKGELVWMNTQMGGGEDAIVETDLNGIALFEGLYPGKYEVREYENYENYAKPKWNGPIYFTIAAEDNKRQHVEAREGLLDYTNKRQHINLTVTKLDADTEAPIEGVVFGLYVKDDQYNSTNDFILDMDSMICAAETDEKGIAKFDTEIPSGQYYIKEIQAAKGYIPSQEIIDVDASWRKDGRENLNLNYTVYNQQTKIRVIKTDENGEILGDVHLAIYDASNNKVTDIITSEGCPFYTVEGLVPGAKYILKEEEPAPGYTTAKYICFRVKGYDKDGNYEPQVVEMSDKPTNITIRINKDDGEYRPRLAPVKYHIEDMEGNVVYIGADKLEYISDEMEDVVISKIPVGDYRLIIDTAPLGYLIPDPFEFTVRDTPDMQQFHVDLKYIKVEIAAIDKETRKVLQHVKVDLMDEGGTLIEEDFAIGCIRENLVPGNYLVHVTQGPSGYLPLGDDTRITVKATDELQRFFVELDHTRIRIVAVDEETGKRLNGVHVDITKNDQLIAYDEPLDYYSERLASGPYVVTAVRVPDQFMTPEPQTFIVRQVPELQIFEVPFYRTRIAIRAVNTVSNNPVKGVKLKLRSRTGTVYGKWTTKYTWKLFRPVEPGDYMLEVLSVPNEYMFPVSELIHVKNLPDIQYFEVKLTPKPVPVINVSGGSSSSGGSTSGTVAASGAAGAASGTAVGSAASGAASAASASGKAVIGSPATGDDLNLMWLYLAIAAECLLAVLYARRRKNGI